MSSRGRPKGSKDGKKRTRSAMTERAKQKRRDDKNRAGNTLMTDFIEQSATAEDITEPPPGEDDVPAVSVSVTFSENESSVQAQGRRPILATLGAEGGDDGDDSDGDEDTVDEPRKGIQQEYLEAVHAQLQEECNTQRPNTNGDWLIDELKVNGWWLRKENAPMIARKLSLAVHHVTYYRDIRVWIPDLQYGRDCLPSCPSCKSNSRVTVHGFDSKHYGRLVIGLTHNYYLMSRRYRCGLCKEKSDALKRSIAQTFEAEDMDVEIEKGFQYTFKPWNEHSLPLLPRSLSEEFPAFLTRKSGVDKSIIDMMRPLINQGIRPDAISSLLLELHSKEYQRSFIRYEEDNAFRCRFGGSYDEYSEFDDVFGYNDKVPRGSYLQSVYIKFHRTIRRHLANEVKKRGGTMISIDVSYKTAKHMCQYKGQPIFKGLVTVTNEFGEIRMQFHVVSDSHEQLEAALESFLKTTDEYGYPPVTIVSTDNPARDKAFLLNMFPSVRAHQQKLDEFSSQTAVVTSEPGLPLLSYDSSNVVTLSKNAEINRYFTAMRNIVQSTPMKAVAVDAEWKVDLNSQGRPTKSHKVALIQFCYLHENGSYKVCLVRTHNLTKLPIGMISFFEDDSIAIVGVQVGGDLARIGKDFKLEKVMSNRREGSVVNLGSYARDRDVVRNGKVGLGHLCEVVLKQRIEKYPHLRFSDWSKSVLDADQVKYAALDALASLQVFVSIRTLPDLNRRLKVDDVVVGKRIDVVPRSGHLSCMATRGATGTIAPPVPCKSPEGVKPDSVKPGSNHAVVLIEEIHSPSLKVPRYKKDGVPATIGDFREQHIVLPVNMLKEHVASDAIRPTPENGEREHPVEHEIRRSMPASRRDAVVVDELVIDDQPRGDESDDEDEQDDSYSITEIVDFTDFTTLDCENLRCAIFSANQSQTGRPPMECEHLDPPPNPESIANKYSAVLGDCFHAMDRPNTPVHHNSKKGYKNALKNAFFMWDPEKMSELKEHLKQAGMDDDEIESAQYFRPTLFHDCVERIVPSPRVLYWRVRAVFALYGNMKDSKTNAPLFNARAWKRANNVLREILEGYYSDPPGVPMYRIKTKEDGSVVKNKYDMDVIECLRGTNRTEAVHKGLVTLFGGHNMGVEMSSCVLAEFRHRYNHRCSERRRDGCPIFGNYDTWEIDKMQHLMLKNHGRLLYPTWSCASDYKDTDESFDTTAIHSRQLGDALNRRWSEMSDDEKSKVKLTSDQRFLSREMNTVLPLLPFTTLEEFRAYNDLVVSGNMPRDEEDVAVEWCKLVDGVNIFPKLPVHIRMYADRWERNQRVKDAVRRAKSGNDKLQELNAAIVPEPDPTPNVTRQSAIPSVGFPAIPEQAMTTEPYVITARTSIGDVPHAPMTSNESGRRGKDRKPRSGRRCKLCLKFNDDDPYASKCKGRGGEMFCTVYCNICSDRDHPNADSCPGRNDRSKCVCL